MVGQFGVAILMLVRPSLPWCFPIRQLSFEQKEQQQQQDEKVAKIIIVIWVSEVTLGSFGMQFSCFSVLHCHGVSHPAAVF